MKSTRLYVRVSLVLLFVIIFAPSVLVAEAIPEIPPNTTIKVRMTDRLTSEDTEVGDIFHGTLDEPIMANGKELYPKGADVSGRVADVHHSGRLSEPGELDLVLTTISSGHAASSIAVQPLVIKGESHTKSNATKIGGGAALGALIGAVAGGGKGAAIGTIAGGAAGTGAAAATGKKPAVVESEAILEFTTSSSSSTASRPSNSAPELTNRMNENQGTQGASTTGTPDTQGNSVGQSAPAPNSTEVEAEPLFTLRDRRVIRSCVDEHISDFPADLLHRPELPFGSEREIKRGGTLPTEASEKAKSLPLDCVNQLPKLPPDMDRVIYNGRVLLINTRNHIIDMFDLEDSD